MVLPFNRTVEKRAAKCLKAKSQVRRTFPAEEVLRALARSVMRAQIHPLLVLPDDTIFDGECRWRGMMLEAPEYLFDVIRIDAGLSDPEVRLLQLAAAMHSNALPAIDQAVACREWLAANPGATAQKLAEDIDLSPGTVSKLTSLWRTVPAVVRAAEEGRIGPKAWSAISRAAEADQPELLARHLAGTPADEIAGEVRKTRRPARPAAPAVRVSSIRTLLPSGISLVAKGEGISLEDLAGAFAEARKEVLKAISDGLTAKTYSAVVAQKSRKAGV